MKIEKLIPDNGTFSYKDHFSRNASTPIKKDAFEFGSRFKKEDKKLEILEYIKLDTAFNE